MTPTPHSSYSCGSGSGSGIHSGSPSIAVMGGRFADGVGQQARAARAPRRATPLGELASDSGRIGRSVSTRTCRCSPREARSTTLAASSSSIGNGIDMCGRSSVSSTTRTGRRTYGGFREAPFFVRPPRAARGLAAGAVVCELRVAGAPWTSSSGAGGDVRSERGDMQQSFQLPAAHGSPHRLE